MEKKKILYFLIIGMLLVISFLIIKEYIIGIISAFVLTYLFLPVFRFFNKYLNKKISAILILGIFIIGFLGFLIFISEILINQIMGSFSEQNLNKLYVIVTNVLDKLNLNENFTQYVSSFQSRIIGYLSEIAFNFISSVPKIVILTFLTFFITYFLFVDWDKILNTIKDIIPFNNKNVLFKRIGSVTKNIVYGLTIIAIIETIIAAIGFGIAGVKFYLLFAVLIGIGAFIPLLGPITIWLPLSIFYIASGNFYSAIIVIITGLILTVIIENFVASILVGKRAKVHPVLMLIGVLGGVPIFGIFGIIIGPLILSIMIEIIKTEYKD